MKNKQVPKTIQRWIDENPSKVETYFVERTGAGQYALTLNLELGLKTTDQFLKPHHYIYAPTVATFFRDVANIEPCLCGDCIEQKARRRAGLPI